MWCFLSLCSSIVTTWNILLRSWRMKRVNLFIYFSRGSSKYSNTLKHIARLDKHSVMPLKSCDLRSVYFAERASRRTATFTKYARPAQRALPVMANSMWLRVWRHGCKLLKHVGLLCRLRFIMHSPIISHSWKDRRDFSRSSSSSAALHFRLHRPLDITTWVTDDSYIFFFFCANTTFCCRINQRFVRTLTVITR